jgi:class 3 adenylate cyclase
VGICEPPKVGQTTGTRCPHLVGSTVDRIPTAGNRDGALVFAGGTPEPPFRCSDAEVCNGGKDRRVVRVFVCMDRSCQTSNVWIDAFWRRAARWRRLLDRHPTPTFVFADLVGYTALTEHRGNDAAAQVAREFGRTMSGLSRAHGARQVKSMGDGVMIWAPYAAGAVALAARAVEEVGTRSDLLPVRVGVHTGPAVMRGRDWYGSAVNVAARLAGEAEPNEALISSAARSAASGELTASFRSRRELVLHGVARPIVAWRLT